MSLRHHSLMLAYFFCALAAHSAESSIAQRCGAHDDRPAARIFASPEEGKGWREYHDIKRIPDLQLSYGIASRVWPGPDGNIFVKLEEPSEDFSAYTAYCFDGAGHLIYLGYELRTAWGWGFREQGSFANNRLNVEKPEFFSIEIGQTIAKPEQAADVPDALKPRIFPTKAALPFFNLLSRPARRQKGTN
jgi:hypothetical protein